MLAPISFKPFFLFCVFVLVFHVSSLMKISMIYVKLPIYVEQENATSVHSGA